MKLTEAVFILISVITLQTVKSGGMVSQLKCYSNVAGVEMKLCEEENGYTSCFTKFNPEGRITGRGCSNKGSNFLFEDDCETFQSRDKTETYCYCSYYLCNHSLLTSAQDLSPPRPSLCLPLLLLPLLLSR